MAKLNSPSDMMAAVSDSMKARTGKTLDEWVQVVMKSGLDPLDQKGVRNWLKSEHGIAQNTQWAIADASARAAGWVRPSVEGYIDSQYEGNKAALRPIFEAIRAYVLRLGTDISVEGRGGYYDNAGVMRDMIQNHLLQVASLVAMEPPAKINADEIRHEKLKVFRSLRPLSDDDLRNNVIRGQYTESHVKGKLLAGYREEEGVDNNSRTETYFAMKFYIDNWRWSGVPFYIRSGKRLPTRVSEIVIHFKPSPTQLFKSVDGAVEAGNQLILRIQPDEGILLKTGMKVPGKGYEVKSVNVDFHYSDLKDQYIPEAYERLILDCMMGDNTLYMSGEGVELTWKFVQPILDYWENDPDAPLYGYPSGSWGPESADDLIEGENQTWRYPCKNLADDGIYCEL